MIVEGSQMSEIFANAIQEWPLIVSGELRAGFAHDLPLGADVARARASSLFVSNRYTQLSH